MKTTKNAHTLILRPLPNRLLWLEAKRQNGDAQIVSAGSIGLETQEDQSPQDVLHHALRGIKSKMDINWFAGCGIILITPGNIYTARHSKTPPADVDTIHEVAEFEVAETLQIPISEISWDFHRSTHQEEGNEVHLIWAAARKSSISALLSTLPKNVLYPSQVTPDFWAVYETILNRNEDLIKEPTLIVYHDGSHINLLVADQQAIYFTRSVGIPGDADTINHISQLIPIEIQRLLAYVPERFETGSIHNVILCGLNHIPMEELRQLAANHPFQCIHITLDDMDSLLPKPAGLDILPEHFPMLCAMYATLLLGQSGINLMDESDATSWWDVITSEEALPPKPILRRIAMLVGAVIVLWASEMVWFQYAAASYLEEGNDLLRVVNHLKDEETALRAMLRSHIDYDELFLFLSEKLPNDVLVKSLTIDTNSGVDLVLTGGNSQLIQEFVAALNTSPYFKDLVESRAAQENNGYTVYIKGKLRI